MHREHDNQGPSSDFDGHLERPWAGMTADEKLRWIDELNELRCSTVLVRRSLSNQATQPPHPSGAVVGARVSPPPDS